MAGFDDTNPLLVEIMAERASAYCTRIRRMEAALAALAEFDRKLASSGPGHEQREHRQELLAEAAEQVWFCHSTRGDAAAAI